MWLLLSMALPVESLAQVWTQRRELQWWLSLGQVSLGRHLGVGCFFFGRETSVVPTSWAGCCWFSSTCHVQDSCRSRPPGSGCLICVIMRKLIWAKESNLRWKGQKWNLGSDHGGHLLSAKMRFLDVIHHGQWGVPVGFRPREWHGLWGLVSLHRP